MDCKLNESKRKQLISTIKKEGRRNGVAARDETNLENLGVEEGKKDPRNTF